MKYNYVTDEQLADYNSSPCEEADCIACSVAHELVERRPNDQQRAQLADALMELSDYPAAYQFIVRQLEMSK